MKSIIATSPAVLPTLAYCLTSPGIENAPVAPLIFPNEDSRVKSKDASSPTILDFHGSSTRDTLTEFTEPTDKETYPRPTISWLTNLSRPKLGSVPYGKILTTCTTPSTIALTFDDGPWKYTSDLLDLLESSGARATFFVCGGNMADRQLTRHGYPSLLRRMVTEGHQVGSHTWSHADLALLDEEHVAAQLLENEQALVQDLGFIPTYLRPPYFSSSEEALGVARGLGYHVVNAGVDTRDWTGDYEAARKNFHEAVQEDRWDEMGQIVLAHDIRERTAHELAKYMIEQADEHGYRLVTVGECLGDPPRNWYRSPSTGESWLSRTRGSNLGVEPDGGRNRGKDDGSDLDMQERAIIPPPDALKEDKSSDPTATHTSRHRLHPHTMPAPTPTHQHKALVQGAEDTKVPTGSSFDPCPFIGFEDVEPWLQWCCAHGYDYHCPPRTAKTVQEPAAASPYMMMDVIQQPTPSTATAEATTAPDFSFHSFVAGYMCEDLHDGYVAVYKTVTRSVDVVLRRGPTGTATQGSGDAGFAWAKPTSVQTITLGHLCKRSYDECDPVYKTVTRIVDYLERSPIATTNLHHHKRLAVATRAAPATTTTSDWPFGKMPPIGGNIPPVVVKAPSGGGEGATVEVNKRSAVASSDAEDIGDHSHEDRRQEVEEGKGHGGVAGEGQNHGERRHEHQHEQQQVHQHQQKKDEQGLGKTSTTRRLRGRRPTRKYL